MISYYHIAMVDYKQYLDIKCITYLEFERIKDALEKQGYCHLKNFSADPSIYQIFLSMQEPSDMDEIRKQNNFKNQVEEMTWYFKEAGYMVRRIQGFNMHKAPEEGLVTFFAKHIEEDDIKVEFEEQPIEKPKSREDILAEQFFNEEKK